MLTIVSPVYNSRECLYLLAKKITQVSKKIKIPIEMILIDDGSSDDSWQTIVNLKKKFNKIKGIKLKKNYGQHYAINVGIKNRTFNTVIVLDCDLSDNPSFIKDLYNNYKKNFNSIVIEHNYKKFSKKSRLLSNAFWYLLSILSLKFFNPNHGNYMLLNKNTLKKYDKVKDIGYLYGDLITLDIKFIKIKKIRNLAKSATTYTFYKLIKLGAKLIFKYNIISRILNINSKKKIYISKKI